MWTADLYRNLLSGYSIVSNGRFGARLRDQNGNPVAKMQTRTFQNLHYRLLRKNKKVFVIDLRKVRALHGNHICKKLYKEIRNAKNIHTTANQ